MSKPTLLRPGGGDEGSHNHAEVLEQRRLHLVGAFVENLLDVRECGRFFLVLAPDGAPDGKPDPLELTLVDAGSHDGGQEFVGLGRDGSIAGQNAAEIPPVIDVGAFGVVHFAACHVQAGEHVVRGHAARNIVERGLQAIFSVCLVHTVEVGAVHDHGFPPRFARHLFTTMTWGQPVGEVVANTRTRLAAAYVCRHAEW
jgi:hypothetical protein